MRVGRFVMERARTGPFGAPVQVRGGINKNDIDIAVRIGRWVYAVGWLVASPKEGTDAE